MIKKESCDGKIRNLKPTDKAQKFTDGDDLYLYMSVTGSKSWRIDYTFEKKRKTHTLGLYPIVSLLEARKSLIDFKVKLKSGIDPNGERKAVKEATKSQELNAFEVIAREWHEKNYEKWKESNAGKIMRFLTKNVFPFLGAKELSLITAPELLEVIREIEDRGTIETAHKTMQICGQVFRYAIATGRAERDITADLKGALKPVKTKHYPTITEPYEIGVLLRKIDNYKESISVQYALKIMPYVFLRSQELRDAKWN